MKLQVCLIYLTYSKFSMCSFPGDELRCNGGSKLSPIMRYYQFPVKQNQLNSDLQYACFEVLLASTCRLWSNLLHFIFSPISRTSKKPSNLKREGLPLISLGIWTNPVPIYHDWSTVHNYKAIKILSSKVVSLTAWRLVNTNIQTKKVFEV